MEGYLCGFDCIGCKKYYSCDNPMKLKQEIVDFWQDERNFDEDGIYYE